MRRLITGSGRVPPNPRRWCGRLAPLAVGLQCLLIAAGAAGDQPMQTDWSGGPGEPGPVLEWADGFQAGDGIAWRSVTGQIALESTPLENPVQTFIQGDAEHPHSVAVGDIDGDGLNDVISPDAVTDIALDLGAIYWWRATGDGTWEQNVVDDDFYGAWYVSTADVDCDGDLDVIGAAYFGVMDPPDPDGLVRNGRYAWFENLHGDGSAWTQHLAGEDFWGARYIAAADLDGDGDVDLAGASELTDGVFEQDGDIVWFENLDGGGTTWAQHDLETNVNGAYEVHIADIDGDGDPDIVSSENSRVGWFENVNGDGSFWIKRYVGAGLASATYVDVGDIDNDGDLDVIGGSYHTVQIGWWENTAGTGSVWFSRYVVDASRGLAIDLGDVDGDGDLDALVGKQTGSGTGGAWWIENTSGDGMSWHPRLISPGYQSDLWPVFADVNNDGRLDAVISEEDFDGVGAQQLSWFDLGEFASEGDLIGSVLDGGTSPDWGVMTWDATIPPDSSLNVQVRASDDPFSLGPFLDLEGPGQDLGDLIDPAARYLQYRLLFSSAQPDSSPVLREIGVQAPLAGDSDGDGDLDLDDFAVLAECLAGPDVLPAPPDPNTAEECLEVFDIDLDYDVDLFDASAFVSAYTGP